ncbi:MAG: efflux RND transporter permease subunit, partial [Propionibacteriaceae bacterium]|nr:efflux RND transporter permease subunit [Propionibacteriaceae bacterium]
MIKRLVRKPYYVLVGVVIVFALGITSLRSMTPELLPNLDLPYVVAVTSDPGASPEKVEEEVTKPLEESFATVDGMKTLTSRSYENYSMLIMEFSDDASMDTAMLDLSQKVEQVSSTMPDGVATPILMKINPDMLPVMVAAVEKDGADAKTLSALVSDTLLPKLEGVDGVASLNTSGIVKNQVNVVIRQDKLDSLDKTVANAVNKKIDKEKRKLEKTQNELEDKLDEVKAGQTKLSKAAKKAAEELGKGSTKLATGSAKLAETATELKNQLAALKTQKTTLQTQRDELAAARAQLAAQIANMTIGKEAAQAKLAEMDAGLAQLDVGLSQIDAGISKLEAGAKTVAQNQTKAEKGQGQLTKQLATTIFELSEGSAKLEAGKASIESAMASIKQGLNQVKETRKSALKQAKVGSKLTMDSVAQLLTAQNFEMPAGYVSQDYQQYLVRVGDEVGSLDELKKLALLDPGIDGVDPVMLEDVADVFMSDNLAKTYTNVNGADGVLITFSKQSQKATTDVTNAIQAKFTELEQANPGLRFVPVMNQSDYIYMVIESLGSDLLWGAVFAIIILLLFLRDFRPTLITLVSIPISLVTALTAMYFSGVTLNILSIGGLAIAVGRLVDDSVVVMENIFRLRSLGYSAIRAAVAGARQVAGAVAASTLTTVCVFLPIVFVQGLTRQLFTDFALTFAYALLASLAVSLTLVPVVASGVFRKMQPREHKWFEKLLGWYDKALTGALRFRWAVLSLAVVLLVGSAFAVVSRGFEYMPSSASGELTVTLKMPADTSTEQRKEIANDAVASLLKVDGVGEVGAQGGSGGFAGGSLMSGSSASSQDLLGSVSIYVMAKDGADAERLSTDVEAALADSKATPTVNDSGMSADMLGTGGITVNLYSEDTDATLAASKTIASGLSSVHGIDTIDDGLEKAEPVLHFTIDKEKAAEHSLTTAQAYQLVAAAIADEKTATNVSWNDENLDVVLVNQYEEDDKLTPEYVQKLVLEVTKPDGSTEKVKLSSIAELSDEETLPMIQRDDQRRVLPVSITIAKDANVTLVSNDVEKVLEGLTLPDNVKYEVTGENTTIMDSFSQLGLMLVLGILLVYLIMVAQFQSLLSPFIIMFTVPLAFTGGLLALLVTGEVLSVISIIGFAMLLGVIVANGIVLVDYINRLRTEGAERRAAIHEGAATRMRPILMTALATIFALL